MSVSGSSGSSGSSGNFLLEWQRNYNHSAVHTWMKESDEVPVLFTVLYLALIFYIPEVLKDKKPADWLAWPMFFWNLLLSAFSMCGLYFLGSVFVAKIWEKGFFWSICAQPSESHLDGAPGFWLMLFVLSKIPEMADTAFLVLQKKPVIFLHWFHHTTVQLYCWHAYVHLIGPGWWFAVINYCAHSVMYLFFAISSTRFRKAAKPFAIIITTFQILQMMTGMVVLVMQRKYKYDELNHGGPVCHGYSESNSRMGIGMYFSYFVLFSVLFRKLYCVADASAKQPKQQQQQVKQIVEVTHAEEGICNATAEAMQAIHPSEPSPSVVGKAKKL